MAHGATTTRSHDVLVSHPYINYINTKTDGIKNVDILMALYECKKTDSREIFIVFIFRAAELLHINLSEPFLN